MPIRVLPQEVASAIAAGEVVERPASVVKELIENSLDAGATRITVDIKNAGRELIEVADNGVGIPADEVPLTIARYATSKLESAEDLFDIHSLGFRGEALSSISAVTRMELVTRAGDEEAGSRLVVEGGGDPTITPVGAPVGTVVRVRDLFFNLPARHKFLKSDKTERRRISELLTRYAVAYASVSFQLTLEGREAFHSSGNGDRREALGAVLGADFARGMIALPTDQEGTIQVRGFVSPPSVNRSYRTGLTFFVNGRWVKDPSLSAAAIQAYHALLMVGRYPVVFLMLEMPAEMLDVNVHPSKWEVRFSDKNLVFSVVQRSVRAMLLGQAPPDIKLERGWASWEPRSKEGEISPDWMIAHAGGVSLIERERPAAQPELPRGGIPLLRLVGQVGVTYLVAEGPDGLYLIDQHAAHERVLFEAMMAAKESEAVQSQRLLEPLLIELPASQSTLLEERLELLKGLGFEVEAFGRDTFRLRAVPALIGSSPPEKALRSVVEDIEEDESSLQSALEEQVAARVCKQAAIKSGQVLSLAEQETLLRNLESCQSPRTCPHGRPTMVHISVATLERQFGRKG